MGFITGFTGGVTLTLGVAYLTVLVHERNRRTQAQILRSQSLVLNNLLEPTPVPPPRTRAELAREERSTLVEAAKDRWNEEIESAVRWVQRKDWDEVREGLEGAFSRLLGSGLQKSREGIEEAEKQAGPIIQEVINRSKVAARKKADQSTADINKAAASTIARAESLRTEAKDGASKINASTKAKAEEAVDKSKEWVGHTEEKIGGLVDAANSKTERIAANTKAGAQGAADSLRGGVVDAVRSVIRDTFAKGVEKGKEVIGMVEAKATSKSIDSDVEKALRQRYEGSNSLNKTVEEALEERYKPLEKQDRTVLRGL